MMRTQLATITRLARAGALERAWALFEASGFDAATDDPDVLTVRGRLLKDKAGLATGATREELLNQSIAAYRRASDLSRATYPLINAATLAFLTGRMEQASGLAAQTLALLDSGDHAPETDYWLGATRAEALLLLNRLPEARAALASAIRRQPGAWEDHASTIRQFSLILKETAGDGSWLNQHRPPPCLHYDGIIGIAQDDAAAAGMIRAKVEEIGPSYAIGALAAGADIIVAEAVLERGGHLHIVLPCLPETFRAASVTPFGAEWEGRFDAALDGADSVVVADHVDPLSSGAVAVAREAAMGLALRESARLQSRASALSVRESDGERERQAAERLWARLSLPMHTVRTRRTNSVRAALTDVDTPPAAFLAVPAQIEDEAAAMVRGGFVEKGVGHSLFVMTDLAEAARVARALMLRRDGIQVALDYRAIARAEPHGRTAALAAAGEPGTVSLSESAALALALHAPDSDVQPIGDARTPLGDLPLYRLF